MKAALAYYILAGASVLVLLVAYDPASRFSVIFIFLLSVIALTTFTFAIVLTWVAWKRAKRKKRRSNINTNPNTNNTVDHKYKDIVLASFILLFVLSFCSVAIGLQIKHEREIQAWTEKEEHYQNALQSVGITGDGNHFTYAAKMLCTMDGKAWFPAKQTGTIIACYPEGQPTFEIRPDDCGMERDDGERNKVSRMRSANGAARDTEVQIPQKRTTP